MTLYEEVRAALRESNFRPRKSLGQNFLVHERVLDSIVRLLDLHESDEVLEIGPGLGFLTRRLVALAGHVYAIELDDFLFARLGQSTLAHSPRLQLIHGDILKVSLDDLLPKTKVKLAANLPYSIATAAGALFHFGADGAEGSGGPDCQRAGKKSLRHVIGCLPGARPRCR
jgi:16S rRNA (adenine1518-N6/adenine1519-N6)-dimethyltransferase